MLVFTRQERKKGKKNQELQNHGPVKEFRSAILLNGKKKKLGTFS